MATVAKVVPQTLFPFSLLEMEPREVHMRSRGTPAICASLFCQPGPPHVAALPAKSGFLPTRRAFEKSVKVSFVYSYLSNPRKNYQPYFWQ